jgi:hypothetical protein
VKKGIDNRKKNLVAAVLGGLGLIAIFILYNELFGGSSAPPAPAPAPVATGSTNGTRISNPSNGSSTNGGSAANSPALTGPGAGLGAAPGVAATKMASTSSSLDPTLDEAAMLRTESLVYSGTGRNIFSLVYTPAAVALPKNVPPPRTNVTAVVTPPPPTGPPPPPPINLKFFGTAVRANGQRQAFLLNGEDVYLAAQGDIVARKYKILSIGANSIQVEDLVYKNSQTLPMQAN